MSRSAPYHTIKKVLSELRSGSSLADARIGDAELLYLVGRIGIAQVDDDGRL